jgi:AraC-like DNA-binding protein
LKKKIKGVFPKIFISLILLLIITIGLYHAIYSNYINKEYENKIYEKNYSSLIFIGNYIDAMIDNINIQLNIISKDKKILNKALVPIRQDLTRDEGIKTLITNVSEESNYIDSIYVYYPFDETVYISGKGIEKKDIFEDKKLIELSNESFLFNISKNEKDNRIISYFYDFPIVGKYKMGTIIININMDTILSVLSEKSKIPVNLSLFSSSDELLLMENSFDKLLKEKGESYINSLKEEGYYKVTIDDKEKILYVHFSEKYGMKCFDILEKPSLFDRQILPTKIIFYLLFIFFLFSIIASLFFSNLFYKPLKKVIQVFGIDYNYDENEYDFLEKNYNSIIDEKLKLENNIKNILPIIQNSFFRRYTRNSYLDKSELEYYENYLDINSYLNSTFVVLVIQVSDSFVEKIENPKLRFKIDSFRKWMQIINTEFEINIYNFTNAFEIVVSCNFGKEIDLDIIEKQVLEYANKIVEYPKNNGTDLVLNIGIGKPLKGLDYLSKSYQQAKNMLQYKLYLGDSKLEIYDNYIEEEHLSSNKSFINEFEEIETKILFSIKISDWESSKIGINQICDLLVKYKFMDKYLISHHFLNLFDKIIEYLISEGIKPNSIFGSTQKLYSTITKTRNLVNIKELFSTIIVKIEKFFSVSSNIKKDKYRLKIENYIHDNYNDSNISLNSIADYLGINPSYFSKLFKKEFNQNFINYLSYYRIEKAKQLLDNTQMSVKEVGFKVGFSTIQSFIRTFKKLEGTTPGKFC